MSEPMICVTLRGHTVEEMVRDASRATAAGADLVEVRFDNLYVNPIPQDPIVSTNAEGEEVVEHQPPILEPKPVEDIDVPASLEQLKDAISLPVIISCRNKADCGLFHGDEDARTAVLSAAIGSGVSWIDLEVDMDADARATLVDACGDATKIIASIHGSETPSADDIVAFVEEHKDSGNIVKGCWKTEGHQESLAIFEAAHDCGGEHDVALMGLGPGGDWCRIHAPLLKMNLVYTTLERDYSLAHRGKINVNDLVTAWRILEYQ